MTKNVWLNYSNTWSADNFILAATTRSTHCGTKCNAAINCTTAQIRAYPRFRICKYSRTRTHLWCGGAYQQMQCHKIMIGRRAYNALWEPHIICMSRVAAQTKWRCTCTWRRRWYGEAKKNALGTKWVPLGQNIRTAYSWTCISICCVYT